MTPQLLAALLCVGCFVLDAQADAPPVVYAAYLVEMVAEASVTPEKRWKDTFSGEQVAYASDPEGFSGNALLAPVSVGPEEELRRLGALGVRKWEGPMFFSSDIPVVRHLRAETNSYIANRLQAAASADEMVIGQLRTSYAIATQVSEQCPRDGLNLSVEWSRVNGWFELRRKGQNVQKKPILVRYNLARCITLPPGGGMLVGGLPLNEKEGQLRELAVVIYRTQ